jgi:transcriptional regulator GlxA family with amidase domain
MAKPTKNLAFVIYPGIRLLDLVGSISILTSLSMGAGFRTAIVAEAPDVLPTDTPIKLMPPRAFADVPNPAALVIVGGGSAALDALTSAALTRYVRSSAPNAEFVFGVGTGALILAGLGLLNGRPATTDWAYAPVLERLGATYVHQPWVDDGSIITAAGVSGAVDASLYLIDKLTNRKQARMTQLFAEYDPEPPTGGLRWETLSGARRAALTPQQETIIRQLEAPRPAVSAALMS